MAQVTLEVPRMLRDCIDGRPAVEIETERLDTVADAIRCRWPVLATHVFTEAGDLRPHVLLLHNDRMTRWMPRLDVPLADGDRLAIVQAVSGG
ncbi:MAG TPA: MoaD/ThiS family protein [Gemmatimonadota bacterium]|nr:MoaD/ThiS family protein [Gemmatimonadota bacterium]